MARTGTFGRSPRSAPSLTSTLLSIAREWQNKRAENIMNAWQKGGMFEGQKATDELVLKFWKERQQGVSKDDPLYDTYKNAQTQLDYAIHESKMTAKYAQGDATDAQMVAFYMNWSKKVPRNSEFFRVLQRDAGQYMRNQRATSEAAARRAAEAAYQRAQAGTQKQKERAGEYVIDTLRRIAQSGYASGGLGAAISAPGSGSDLTDFDPSDPNLMLRLIAAITPQGKEVNEATGFTVGSGKFNGNKDVIFHDDDGKGWTGSAIMAEIGKLDPTFSPKSRFDVNYVTGIIDRQMQGLNERIARANKTGHMQDVVSLMKSKSYVSLLNREIAAYPVQAAYNEARADYDAVVRDASSSPNAVMKAWTEYSATLTKLAGDPRIATDDNMRSRLVAEVNGDAGIPTLHESFTGLANAQFDASSAKDAAENKAGIEFMQAQIDAVEAGNAVWTYGEKDSNGIFVPQAGGRQIGAATEPAAQSGGVNGQYVTIDDPRGGIPLKVLVTAVPVFATARNPVTGEPLAAQNNQPIAYAYDIPKGSGTQTQYGFMTNEGMVFSTNPPWADGLKTVASSKGGNHLEVDLTPVVEKLYGGRDPSSLSGGFVSPLDLEKGKPQMLGTSGFSMDKASSGKGLELTYDPQAAAWATDTRNGLGSTDPMTDFKSLTLATLMADEDGRNILTNLDKNPSFKQQLDDDAYAYSGAQRDAKTGAWMPETADPNKLAAAMGQQNIATSAKSFVDFVTEASKTWQRFTTGSPFKPTSVGNSSQTGALPSETLTGFTKLATDLLKGTPFAALGNAFSTGTNNIKPPAINEATGFTIKPVTTIKAPAIPDVKPPAPVTLPTNVYKPPANPPQMGSTPPQSGSKPPSINPYTGFKT